MEMIELWNRSREIDIKTSPEICGNFDVGFDPHVPEQTKDLLMSFIYWVEDHYHLPVTLWVDFKYRHYLRDPQGKPVDYRFYWVDFAEYPVFQNPDDIPVIELPVRLEKRSAESLLACFAEAITHYFAWLTNEYFVGWEPDQKTAEAIVRLYLSSEDAFRGAPGTETELQ